MTVRRLMLVARSGPGPGVSAARASIWRKGLLAVGPRRHFIYHSCYGVIGPVMLTTTVVIAWMYRNWAPEMPLTCVLDCWQPFSV